MDLKQWSHRLLELPKVNDSPESVLEEFGHILERSRSGQLSQRVMRQLARSERSYKGWSTRRDKETNNG